MMGKIIGVFLVLIIGIGVITMFTDGIEDLLNSLKTDIDAKKNEITTEIGKMECDLKVNVYGFYSIPLFEETLYFNNQESRVAHDVERFWYNCSNNNGVRSFELLFYNEKFLQNISDFKQQTLLPVGNLFGEEIKFWVELYDPITGKATIKPHHNIVIKIAAQNNEWNFKQTFIFEDVPRKDLELRMYTDVKIKDHAQGAPYIQKINP